MEDLFEQAENAQEEAQLAFDRGDVDEARRLHEQALGLWRQGGYPVGEARALFMLGVMVETRGKYVEAQAFYERAHTIFSDHGIWIPEAPLIVSLGRVLFNLGEYSEAEKLYEQALPLSRQKADQLAETGLVLGLGDIAMVQEDHDKALGLYERALLLGRQTGDQDRESQILFKLGNVARSKDEYDQAKRLYEQALPLSRQVGNQNYEAQILEGLGTVAAKQGEWATAQQLYRQALALYRQKGDRKREGAVMLHLAMDAPLADESRQWAEQARVIFRETGRQAEEKLASKILAWAIKAQSSKASKDKARKVEALSLLKEALEIATELQLPQVGEWAEEYEKINKESQEEQLEAFFQDLDNLIGLNNVKQRVREIVNYAQFQKMRQQSGIPVSSIAEHMVFTGNPGTGKTTVARLLANMYGALDILSAGHTVEADRSTLVGAYLGQTAQITREVVESAIGGVLFIDEAYSLTPENKLDSFGQEAINTLLKLMEDRRGDLIVIIAGYTGKMRSFIASNPGLQSRFTTYLHFDDYQPEDLVLIFESFCEQNHYQLEPGAGEKLLALFTDLHQARDDTFGNARLARNVFEKSTVRLAGRVSTLANFTKEDLTLIRLEDIPNSLEFRGWQT